MNAKSIYKTLVILLGYGLVIAGFVLLGAGLDNKVKTLDIIASCLIITQFMEFTLFPLVNLNSPDHKEIGMMGLHLTSINTCCALSLVLMVCGIIYDIPFLYQLIGQLAILFLLLLGRLATLHAGEKTARIYNKERQALNGKEMLKGEMEAFLFELGRNSEFDTSHISRLQAINESLRFITPSNAPEASALESQIVVSIDELRIMSRQPSLNKAMISDEIGKMERLLTRRKNIRA